VANIPPELLAIVASANGPTLVQPDALFALAPVRAEDGVPYVLDGLATSAAQDEFDE
jgi:hypothetical protein